MKKTWFDARLYREGLRQLRVIGILSFVVMALGAILVPVGEAISYSSQIAVQTAQAGAEFNPEIMTLMRAHPLLMLVFLHVLGKGLRHFRRNRKRAGQQLIVFVCLHHYTADNGRFSLIFHPLHQSIPFIKLRLSGFVPKHSVNSPGGRIGQQ